MKSTRQPKSACVRARGISHKSLVFVLFATLAVGLGLALFNEPRAAAEGSRVSAAKGQKVAPVSAATAPSLPDLLWMKGGHAGGYGKAALSPDGQTLATADYAEVYLWRYADGQLVGTLNAPWIDSVKTIKFTPDGQHVVAGGTWIAGSPNASTLRMWRIADRSLVREFAVTWDVKSIALSADGKHLAAAVGGGDPSVILFDVATGARVRTLGHFAANAVAFSRDGFVAAAGADEFGDPPTVPVWRASDGLQVAKLTGLNFITDAVAFSPDGRYLAAGDWGGNGATPKIMVWVAPTFLPVQTLTPYAGSGGSIAFSPDSQTLAGASAPDRVISFWHLPDGLKTQTIPVNIHDAVWNIIFSDNDTFFASGAQNIAEVRRVSDGALLRTVGSNREFVNSSAFSPDGAHLVVANGSGASGPNGAGGVEMLRASDGAYERTLATHNDLVNAVAFAPDGTRVASASGSQPPDTRDTRILISPVASGPAQVVMPGHAGGTLSLSYSPDGQTLASSGRDNAVKLWRTSDGALLRTINGHANWVHSVAYSPDGLNIASGSGDSKVKIWRASDGALVRTIQGNGYPVGSVAYSPDGQTIALTANGAVQLWRAADGVLLRTMYVEAGFTNMSNLVYSKDGGVVGVANGSYAPTIWFWRTSDGALLKTYNRETGWVQPPSLALSPDNKVLGIGRYDSIVEMARFEFADASSYAPAYEGEVVGDCDQLTGWAWDSKQPDGAVSVDIYDGATLLATVAANHYRQDLAGKGNGYHAFQYTIPVAFKNGTTHTFTVKFSGSNVELTGSPKSLTCGSAPLPGSWANTATVMPTARRSFVAGVIDGRIYAAGGDSNSGERGVAVNPLSTPEAYDTATNSWTTLAPMPTRRFGAAGGVIGGKLYVAGGWNNDYSVSINPYKDMLEAYDPASNSWATLAPMPRARYNLAAGVIDGKLYAVGGYDPGVGYTNELAAYDPASNSWATLAPMPTGRYALAAVALNGKLYAVGGGCAGCGSPSSGYSRDLEAYDPASNSWTRLAPMPTGRYNIAAAALGGKLYVLGGARGGVLDTVDVYDPATDTWATTAPMRTPREYLAAVTLGGGLYALGGADASHVVRDIIEVYTPGAATNPTPTPTPASTPTPTPTPTATPTPTPTSTPTPTPTPTVTTVILSGLVMDKSAGAGASGLTVTLSGDATATTQTDAQGRYSFAGLPPGGAYTVMVTSPGWLASPYARTYLDC
ncbi:MAG TPA: kelch repeat-containing protein, partial [Pyrinomonadaceae bacterium]